MNKKYEIIVIGGGHAGIEAAHAASNMGCSVGLITMDKDALGRMSCNPAIGGTAKGHLVREIDALGGIMAGIADRTGIQFRMLYQTYKTLILLKILLWKFLLKMEKSLV